MSNGQTENCHPLQATATLGFSHADRAAPSHQALRASTAGPWPTKAMGLWLASPSLWAAVQAPTGPCDFGLLRTMAVLPVRHVFSLFLSHPPSPSYLPLRGVKKSGLEASPEEGWARPVVGMGGPLCLKAVRGEVQGWSLRPQRSPHCATESDLEFIQACGDPEDRRSCLLPPI